MSDQRADIVREMNKAAEDASEKIRGAQDTYFNSMEQLFRGMPWMVEFTKNWHRFAKEHMDVTMEFSEKLPHAKDPGEFVRLQSEFMMKQFQLFTAHSKELVEAFQKQVASVASKNKV